MGSFGSPSGFSGILRDLSESFGNPSEAFGSPPESFRNLRDSGILRDPSEILQESSKCCCQLIFHAKKIDKLQTFSPREEIKQQGVKLTGTENLSATLPRQLEGRTKKRQPGHLDLAEVGILRGSFGNPSESCRNFGNSSNTSAFGVLRESFGIPQNLRASFGILRDPS